MRIARSVDDGVATLTLDDGKANAFDLAWFHELDGALDDCEDDVAVVLSGRDGMFSGGLNTKELATLDPDGLHELLAAFGSCMLRTWLEPRPVVVAATGHAVGGGTILAMAADHAVAASGDFRWGLTETTLGFPMPGFALAIARANVAAHRLDAFVLTGRLVPPHEAVEVGYADELSEPAAVRDRAAARARELAELPAAAFAATKRRLRAHVADAARADLARDLWAVLRERKG